uniref:Uncharacterized protein n=1 Tax=Oryza glumipatula TaxID=40148 RepID=A0A0D9Z2Z7_9ORYZ
MQFEDGGDVHVGAGEGEDGGRVTVDELTRLRFNMRDQLQDTSVSNSHQQALHGGAQGSQKLSIASLPNGHFNHALF